MGHYLHDFDRLTGMRSYGPPIELRYVSYQNETILYYVLAKEFESQSQVTPED